MTLVFSQENCGTAPSPARSGRAQATASPVVPRIRLVR
jgi:hypothetical protein